MLKKIKDLTKEEINKICEKYKKRDKEGNVHCYECPLAYAHSYYEYGCIKTSRRKTLQEIRNKEIEIEENE